MRRNQKNQKMQLMDDYLSHDEKPYRSTKAHNYIGQHKGICPIIHPKDAISSIGSITFSDQVN